jgi:hypothetical protein
MQNQADAVVHAKELARRTGGAYIVVSDERGALASEFFYQGEQRTSHNGGSTKSATRPVTLPHSPPRGGR